MFQGKLPTLDIKIWIDEKTNRVMFSFFEKPMVARTVLMKRSAMPENTRMATLNQEMIRRMVNTSEHVDMDTRLEVIDDYARKLVNSEYDLGQTRRVIVGGLKGYERMLSLSKNKETPNWKPLHLPTSYKSKERRISKMMAKTNWFKSREEQGKEKIQPVGRFTQPSDVQPSGSGSQPTEVGDQPAGISIQPSGTRGGVMDKEPTVGRNGRAEGWKKKRGKDKPTLSLAGRRKMEKAARKKERRRINRQMGRAGVKPNQKNPASRNIKNIPTISVLFVEQTPGGALAKRLQEAETEIGKKTGYKIRIDVQLL